VTQPAINKITKAGTKIKKPFRGNGTASNDCLPYEKFLKLLSCQQAMTSQI